VLRGKREKRLLAGGEATGGGRGGVGKRRAEGEDGTGQQKGASPSLGFRARLSYACTTPRVSVALPPPTWPPPRGSLATTDPPAQKPARVSVGEAANRGARSGFGRRLACASVCKDK
jgi:hypothetical protein